MENKLPERTEKDKLVLELVNSMKGWLNTIHGAQDLYISEVGHMQTLMYRFMNQYDIGEQGRIEEDGEIVSYSCYDCVFREDPSSLVSRRKLKEEEDGE